MALQEEQNQYPGPDEESNDSDASIESHPNTGADPTSDEPWEPGDPVEVNMPDPATGNGQF